MGALDEMQARSYAVDGDVEAYAALADELERIRHAPRIVRSERRGPARVALVEQEPRRGVDGPPVGRMRLSAEAPEIGVDEAGVDRSRRDLRARAKARVRKRDWSSAR